MTKRLTDAQAAYLFAWLQECLLTEEQLDVVPVGADVSIRNMRSEWAISNYGKGIPHD